MPLRLARRGCPRRRTDDAAVAVAQIDAGKGHADVVENALRVRSRESTSRIAFSTSRRVAPFPRCACRLRAQVQAESGRASTVGKKSLSEQRDEQSDAERRSARKTSDEDFAMLQQRAEHIAIAFAEPLKAVLKDALECDERRAQPRRRISASCAVLMMRALEPHHQRRHERAREDIPGEHREDHRLASGTKRYRATPVKKNIGTKTMQMQSVETNAGSAISPAPSRIALIERFAHAPSGGAMFSISRWRHPRECRPRARDRRAS